MNKRELIESAWIPIHKRLPPDSDEKIIFFSALTGNIHTTLAKVLRIQVQQVMDGLISLPNFLIKEPNARMRVVLKEAGYFASHWMPKFPPRKQRTCAVCYSPQFESPAGWVCENGHGDAPSIEEDLGYHAQ